MGHVIMTDDCPLSEQSLPSLGKTKIKTKSDGVEKLGCTSPIIAHLMTRAQPGGLHYALPDCCQQIFEGITNHKICIITLGLPSGGRKAVSRKLKNGGRIFSSAVKNRLQECGRRGYHGERGAGGSTGLEMSGEARRQLLKESIRFECRNSQRGPGGTAWRANKY